MGTAMPTLLAPFEAGSTTVKVLDADGASAIPNPMPAPMARARKPRATKGVRQALRDTRRGYAALPWRSTAFSR